MVKPDHPMTVLQVAVDLIPLTWPHWASPSELGKPGTVVKEASSGVGSQWARRSCDGATGTPAALLGVPAGNIQKRKGEKKGRSRTRREKEVGGERVPYIEKEKEEGRAEIDN